MSLRFTTALLASLAVLVPCASAEILPGVSHRSRVYDSASHKEASYVVGYPGLVLRTTDHGGHFTPVKVPTQDALFSIDINQAGLGAIVGRSGLVLITKDGGATWTKTNAIADAGGGEEKPHLFAVDVLENGAIVAVGSFATIVRSTDQGATWQRSGFDASLPSEPNAQKEEDKEEDMNAGFEEEARLTGVSFGDDKIGYVVGEFGMVLRSEDGGANFKRQRSATETLLFSVHAVSTTHAVASGGDGSIVETTDGRTWKRLASGTTNHLFGVWASEDLCIAVGQDGTVVLRKGPSGSAFQTAPTLIHTWLSSVALHDSQHGIVTGGLGHLLLTKDAGATFSVLAGE